MECYNHFLGDEVDAATRAIQIAVVSKERALIRCLDIDECRSFHTFIPILIKSLQVYKDFQLEQLLHGKIAHPFTCDQK